MSGTISDCMFFVTTINSCIPLGPTEKATPSSRPERSGVEGPSLRRTPEEVPPLRLATLGFGRDDGFFELRSTCVDLRNHLRPRRLPDRGDRQGTGRARPADHHHRAHLAGVAVARGNRADLLADRRRQCLAGGGGRAVPAD